MSSDKKEHDSSPLLMLPVEISDLIFQHLTGELLTMSEVSPSFYDYVAGSRRCMRDIKMELTAKNAPPREVLLESSRKYERLVLSKSHVDLSREILSVAGRTWKEVCISGVDFETVNDFLDYLRVFQSTVEELSLTRVYVNRNLKLSELSSASLEFPNLKSLEMICSFATFYDKAFVECRNLTSFFIKSGGEMGDASLKAIRNILKTNDGLRRLKISYEVFYLLFSEDLSKEINFKLKEFHADSIQRASGNQTNVRRNLNAFLINQSGSLESLTLGKWMGGDVLKTILSMPRLKKVTLMGFEGVDSEELDDESFSENFSVTSLDLSNFFTDDVIRLMLKCFPKAETVTISP